CLAITNEVDELVAAVSILRDEDNAKNRDINAIAVAQQFRNKGYLRQMLRVTAAYLHDRGIQTLSLYAKDPPIFRQCGFVSETPLSPYLETSCQVVLDTSRYEQPRV